MTPIVSLPMYDWPEVSDAVDRFWAAIRSSLDELDVAAPEHRARPDELVAHWRDPALLLSQTCGLPLRRHLQGEVVPLGAFDHRLPDTAPGDYHSVIIVAVDDPAEAIADLRGATAAVNGADSQSGHAALRHALVDAPDAVTRGVASGGHRASVELVANGDADVAAIDAVSWELARVHEPAATRCRVLTRTPPTPGLPVITALGNAPLRSHLRAAVAHGIGLLDEADRAALHMHAFVGRDDDDYVVIDERWDAADAAGVPHLL